MRLPIKKSKCNFKPQEYSIEFPKGSILDKVKGPTLKAITNILSEFFVVISIDEKEVNLEERN